jgi:2'-5' RNA ligase
MDRFFLAMPVTLFDYEGLRSDFEHTVHGRWIPQPNLHLTLQFFGQSYEKEFLLTTLCALHLHAQDSELKGLALLKKNRILYAKTQNASLTWLYEKVQNAFGLCDAREFTPHVTLMRITKIPYDELLQKRLLQYKEKVIGKVHGEILLMQSHLDPEGVRYSVVKRFNYPNSADI